MPENPCAAALDRLARRRLIVVGGKGGVGKSAVAATLGWWLAGRGRRVLLLELDPRESVHRLFGLPPSGGEEVTAAPGLSLQGLKPRQVLDGIIRQRVRLGAVARRVLASPIYHQLAEGMPGLRELAVISHAYEATAGDGGGRFDVAVLDSPATGHGVSLLAAPRLVSEVIAAGPVGAIARELAALVADPERCGIVVVTQAEEMPVEEALELRAMLAERLEREAELLVVNGLYPPLPAAEANPQGPGGDPALGLWRQRRQVNERELGRLRAVWTGPRLELPQLAVEPGPELVRELAARIAAAARGRR